MLQIISNSNETSTGPELVQNGNFSQLGADLVENGLFDELGTDVITNGGFTGVTELITNGDFTNGAIGWTISGTWALDGTAVRGTSAGVLTQFYQLDVYTPSNKTYVVSFEIISISAGGVTIELNSAEVSEVFTTIGVKTVSLDSTGGNGHLTIRGVNGNLFSGVIDNVSVKEEGEDWTNGTVWSFGDSKAISTQALGSEEVTNGDFSATGTDLIVNGIFDTTIPMNSAGSGWFTSTTALFYNVGGVDGMKVPRTTSNAYGVALKADNSNLLTANTSYKISYEVLENNGSGGVYILAGAGTAVNGAITTGVTHTIYITSGASNYLRFYNQTNNSDYTITNVTCEELGQDWTLVGVNATNTITFESGGARVNSVDANISLRQNALEVGKSYKLTCDITETIGALALDGSVGGTTMILDEGFNEVYFTALIETLKIKRYSVVSNVLIDNISVKEIATSYLTQAVSLSAKTWKIIYSVSDYIAGSVSATDYGAVTTANAVGITEYVEIGVASDFRMVNINGYFEGAVTDISAQLVDPNGYWTLGTGWTFGEDVAISDGSVGSITQSILTADVFYKIRIKVTGNPTLLVFSSTSFYGDEAARTLKNGTHNYYLQAKVAAFSITNEGGDACTITNISVEQTDPNNYWTLGTGWSIGTDKAISTITSSNSDITQSILTAGKTYRTVYEIVDYDAGTAQAVVTGSAGADAVAIETYTEDLTTTGTDFSIRSKLGTFDGSVSSVSAKLLGSYEDQSIYVTAADVQTLPQASVYYLVELTSMASKNSIYFIPSSVVPNNGRYTKLNFTVVSKDALTQPTVGIISFYDSVGGFDTYPMGFYEFKIYEQTSSTNLDPTLATGLLEKGFAFVRDFSGNMQELTDGFKEYNPTLTQYVYSK